MFVGNRVFRVAIITLLFGVGCRRTEETTSSTQTTTAADRPGTTASQTGQGANAATLAEDDITFLKKAASGNAAEIGAARHVAQAGANAEVKAFANKLLTEHSKAQQELQTLAKKKGVELPTEMAGDNKDTMASLTKLSGKELDKRYAKEMVERHDDHLKEHKDALKELKDPDLRAWVEQKVGQLEGHYSEAKVLEQKL